MRKSPFYTALAVCAVMCAGAVASAYASSTYTAQPAATTTFDNTELDMSTPHDRVGNVVLYRTSALDSGMTIIVNHSTDDQLRPNINQASIFVSADEPQSVQEVANTSDTVVSEATTGAALNYHIATISPPVVGQRDIARTLSETGNEGMSAMSLTYQNLGTIPSYNSFEARWAS